MTHVETQRIDLARPAGGPLAAMARLEERVALDAALRELVNVRASQINGCAFCVDFHWSAARAAGHSEQRLATLAVWHESPFFDDRERAALALCESMTRVAETHVPADVWELATQHFDADELAHLMFEIGAINLWNRIWLAARRMPVLDEPGEHAAAA